MERQFSAILHQFYSIPVLMNLEVLVNWWQILSLWDPFMCFAFLEAKVIIFPNRAQKFLKQLTQWRIVMKMQWHLCCYKNDADEKSSNTVHNELVEQNSLVYNIFFSILPSKVFNISIINSVRSSLSSKSNLEWILRSNSIWTICKDE